MRNTGSSLSLRERILSCVARIDGQAFSYGFAEGQELNSKSNKHDLELLWNELHKVLEEVK